MKANSLLRRLDTRTMRPAQRFAYGVAWGIVMVLGIWLISTLQHAQQSNLGITWQWAVALVLITGFISISSGVRRSKH
jgi:cobalamin biosynthesis protein CobD/CbiB